MQNMMCAIRIVPKPSEKMLTFKKSVRSAAASTTSGVAIGTKMRRFVAPRPRNP